MQFTMNLNGYENNNFQLTLFDGFLIFAKNKKCGKVYTPVNPSFSILKGGARAYKLHSCVMMMSRQNATIKQT